MIDALRVRCGEGRCGEEGGSVHVKKKSRTDETSSGGDDIKAASDDKKNNSSSGCNWEGTLGDWRDAHQKECPFILVPCPDECGKRVRRMDMEEHKSKECPIRKVECGLCHAMIEFRDIQYHKYKCPKEMEKCDFCKTEMTREKLGEYGGRPKERLECHPIQHSEWNRTTGHYAVCPKMVLLCEFDCCRSQFRREDAAKHHAENAQRHAALVNEKIETLENWDFVRMSWIIPRRKLVTWTLEDTLLRSKVLSGVTQYELYLTLHLRGLEDPIEVALCSDAMSCWPGRNYTTLKGFELTVNENESYSCAKTYATADLKEEIIVSFEDGERGVFKFSSKLKKEIYPDSEDEDQDVEPIHDFTRSDMFEYMRDQNSDGVMISARFYIQKYRDVYLSCDDE